MEMDPDVHFDSTIHRLLFCKLADDKNAFFPSTGCLYDSLYILKLCCTS